MSEPRRIVFDQRQSPGDVLVFTAALKALHQSQPGRFITDYVGHCGRLSEGNDLFANNPYVTPFYDGPAHNVQDFAKNAQHVMADYGYAIQSCGRSYHFLHGFAELLSHKLGVHIELRDFRPDVYLSDEEREPWPGLPERYAIIDAGRKADFTAKLWSTHRFQEVVNATKDRIAWVQVGSSGDYHPPLENVINIVGQTNLRQLIRVMHRASLVLTPVSLPMHLAAAVPMPCDDDRWPKPTPVDEMHRIASAKALTQFDGRGKVFETPQEPQRKIRPCVVLMGQREPRHWEHYPGHAALGTEGRLQCGILNGCGCWRNKSVKVDNDNSICMNAMADEAGQMVPECLHRVTSRRAIEAIEAYL